MSSHPTSRISILILSSHLRLGLVLCGYNVVNGCDINMLQMSACYTGVWACELYFMHEGVINIHTTHLWTQVFITLSVKLVIKCTSLSLFELESSGPLLPCRWAAQCCRDFVEKHFNSAAWRGTFSYEEDVVISVRQNFSILYGPQ
jgi:hypothetical protein